MLPTLVRMLTLRVGSRWVAEDLAQEALARALADWDRVRSQRYPSNYVYRIAVRLAASNVRRRRSERRALQRLRLRRPTAEPGTDFDEANETDLLRHLESLTRREREVVSLRFGADLSVQATAEALGITEGTVKTLSHRAMAKLRRHMQAEATNG